jgi:putative acetyltransferase
MNIIVRPETASDEAAIHALTVAAFREALHTSHTEQLIVDALRKTGALSVSLVAESKGGCVGHVAASPVVITDCSPGWFGLGPLSVLPEYQGRGVGSRLMREVLGILKDRGAAG